MSSENFDSELVMPEKESSQNEALVDSDTDNSDGKENIGNEVDLSKAEDGWDKPNADGISAKVHRGKIKSTKKEMKEKDESGDGSLDKINSLEKPSQSPEYAAAGSQKTDKEKLDLDEKSVNKNKTNSELNKGDLKLEQDKEENPRTKVNRDPTKSSEAELLESGVSAENDLVSEQNTVASSSEDRNSSENTDKTSSNLSGDAKEHELENIKEKEMEGSKAVVEDTEKIDSDTRDKHGLQNANAKEDEVKNQKAEEDQTKENQDTVVQKSPPDSNKRASFVEKDRLEAVTKITAGLGKYINVRGSAKPISHWVFSETGKNDIFVDAVGGYDATIYARPRESETELNPEEQVFDDEYFEVKHVDELKPEHGTLCFWFRIEDTSEPATLVSCDSSSLSVNGGLNIRVFNGMIAFGMEDGEDKVHRILGGKIEEDIWYHAAVTWGQNGLYLFLNGELIDSNKQFKRGLGKNTNDWIFGASRAGTTWLAGVSDVTSDEAEFFRGSIDDIALYDFQINYVEIGILYEHGVEAFMNSVDEDVIEVPLNVDLTVAPPYTLGSVSILFAGIPESVELSAGRDDGDGNLLLYNDNLIGLKFWTADLKLRFSAKLTVKLRNVSGVDDELINTILEVNVPDLEAEKLD